jgi:hypothetical protein
VVLLLTLTNLVVNNYDVSSALALLQEYNISHLHSLIIEPRVGIEIYLLKFFKD